MPRTKPIEPPDKLRRVLVGYGITAAVLADLLGCSRPTALKRINDTKLLTVGDLWVISRRAHIPIDELREAI